MIPIAGLVNLEIEPPPCVYLAKNNTDHRSEAPKILASRGTVQGKISVKVMTQPPNAWIWQIKYFSPVLHKCTSQEPECFAAWLHE